MNKLSMDEMLAQDLKGVTPMNNPDCKDCNECCSMATLLTNEEFERLKRFLKKDKYGRFLYQEGINLISRYFKQRVVYWMCPFSHGKRCRIYKKRPLMCREFHCDSAENIEEFKDKHFPKGNSNMIVELFEEGFKLK